MKLLIFEKIIETRKIIILDGAMGTEIERRGFKIDSSLWSAKIVYSNPELIKKIHMDYLDSGAEIITSSSYQASKNSFKREINLSGSNCNNLMIKSILICNEARNNFLKDKNVEYIPLIAASSGPYGAYLSNYSEYNGKYIKYINNRKKISNYHKNKILILKKGNPDIFAFETIPSVIEAEIISRLVNKLTKLKFWISFSMKNSEENSFGENIEYFVSKLEKYEKMFAIGVNCVSPKLLTDIIKQIKKITKKK